MTFDWSKAFVEGIDKESLTKYMRHRHGEDVNADDAWLFTILNEKSEARAFQMVFVGALILWEILFHN